MLECILVDISLVSVLGLVCKSSSVISEGAVDDSAISVKIVNKSFCRGVVMISDILRSLAMVVNFVVIFSVCVSEKRKSNFSFIASKLAFTAISDFKITNSILISHDKSIITRYIYTIIG